MTPRCLLCEGEFRCSPYASGERRFVAVCSDCYGPVEDSSDAECLRGFGLTESEALADLVRVQNEYIDEQTCVGVEAFLREAAQ